MKWQKLAVFAVMALVALFPHAHVQAETASTISIEVYKDPSCGCCGAWVEHLQQNGFSPIVHDRDDMGAVKQKLGVPENLASCHTAKIGDYVIEGHVPARDILRLLKEKPSAQGLSVPGMIVGSPGMEMEGRPAEKYDVMLFAKDGGTEIYSSN